MKKIPITILIILYYFMNTYAYAEITVNVENGNISGLNHSLSQTHQNEYNGLTGTNNLSYAVQNITSYFVNLLYIYAIIGGNYKALPLIFLGSSFVRFTTTALASRSYYY